MYKQEDRWLDFNWRSASEALSLDIPPHIREQLLKAGSLTCNLEQQTQRKFRVELINSGWFYVKPSEAEILAMPSIEKAWIRQVFLRSDRKIWVYAWSVFPATTLVGQYKSLQRMGCKSLDKILFSQAKARTFQIVQIGRESPIYQKVTQEETVMPNVLWARRSCYHLNNRALLVNEVFLPRAFGC